MYLHNGKFTRAYQGALKRQSPSHLFPHLFQHARRPWPGPGQRRGCSGVESFPVPSVIQKMHRWLSTLLSWLSHAGRSSHLSHPDTGPVSILASSEEQQSISSLGHIDYAHHFQTLIRPDLKQPLRRALRALFTGNNQGPEGRPSPHRQAPLPPILLTSHKSLESQINQEMPLSFLK